MHVQAMNRLQRGLSAAAASTTRTSTRTFTNAPHGRRVFVVGGHITPFIGTCMFIRLHVLDLDFVWKHGVLSASTCLLLSVDAVCFTDF